MATWVDGIERRAEIVIGQLAAAVRLAPKTGLSAEDVARPYTDLLQDLYKNELPLARLMDTSDLIVEFKGPAVDRDSLILKVVSGAFFNIREEMQRVTRAIVGLAADQKAKLPENFELALTGMTRGSLTVGISVARALSPGLGETAQILGDQDPLYDAVRGAIRSIALVTKHLGDDGIESSLAEDIPDPAVRDAVSVAAKRLAPTGRLGINTVSISSPGIDFPSRELTPKLRRALTVSLRSPVQSKQRGSFEGIVREIDLDARRFEVRHVLGEGAVRCAYSEELDKESKKFLDARIRVSGLIERSPSGELRMMQVDRVKIIAAARRASQRKLKLG